MDKSILEQYIFLKNEIEREDRLIRRLENELKKICVVQDTVLGSRGEYNIYGPICVNGYPFKTEKTKKKLLEERKWKREKHKEKLEEMVSEVEECIDSIQNSKIRQMTKIKYMEGMTWQQVASEMNKIDRKKYYSEDACRVLVNDYLKKAGLLTR